MDAAFEASDGDGARMVASNAAPFILGSAYPG